MKNNNIYFIGDDPDYVREGMLFFEKKKKDNLTFVQVTAHLNFEIYSLICKKDAFIIFIDFTNKNLDHTNILRQIAFIKRHKEYRQIVFLGLFENKHHLDSMRSGIFCGLNYLHIKGTDSYQLFSDSLYLAYGDTSTHLQYAQIKNLNLEYKLQMPSFITTISNQSLVLNTDYDTESSEIEVSYSFLGTPRTDRFGVINRADTAVYGHAMFKYELSYPALSPWENIEADSLLPDTIETWLSLYENFRQPARRFLVYTFSDTLFQTLLNKEIQKGSEYQFEQDNFLARLEALQPEIALIDYDLEKMGDFIVFFESIVEAISNIEGYSPYFIIFNSPMSSDEFHDATSYKRTICHPLPCDVTTLDSILNMYNQKKKQDLEELVERSFSLSDLNSMVQINIPIKVMSLTEHEITFTSPHPLVMFSLLHLDVPVDCTVLIIPPLKELSRVKDQFHYMGIIMGVDQLDLNQLRSFVNKAIFTPLKEFKKPDKSVEQPGEVIPEVIEVEEKKTVEVVPEKIIVSPWRNFKKSKL